MRTRQVLDHGYVQLIEGGWWGSDQLIVEAARQSTQKGFNGWGTEEKPGDEKLLRYLWEHRHHTPFEMAGATFEIMAPIFVFREWHRHRTQSYNEMSARYIPLPDVNYIPDVDRVMMNAGTNKQAQGVAPLDRGSAEAFVNRLGLIYENLESNYQLNLRSGIPKELARIVLPVGRYSRMRASANLRNWLHFLSLRLDESAQWEIRQYAKAVHEELRSLFPRTAELFDEKPQA